MDDIVSRDMPPKSPGQSRASALLDVWRGLLTRLIAAWRRWFDSAITAAGRALSTLYDIASAARTGSASARDRLTVVAGSLAIVTGVGATVLLAAPELRARTWPGALVAALWVCARLVAMRLASRSTESDSRTLTAAWAAGALPHLFAVTPDLRVLAWLAGFAITFRKLRVSGSSARDAMAITGWGYGLEVAGFVLLALARSLQFAFLWLGGATG